MEEMEAGATTDETASSLQSMGRATKYDQLLRCGKSLGVIATDHGVSHRGEPFASKGGTLTLLRGAAILRGTCRRLEPARYAALSGCLQVLAQDLRMMSFPDLLPLGTPRRYYSRWRVPQLRSIHVFTETIRQREPNIPRYPSVTNADDYFEPQSEAEPTENANQEQETDTSDHDMGD